jgi:DNA polymerase-3 subunit delta'
MDIFGLLKNTNAYGKFVSLARAGKIPHAALLYFKDEYAAANMLKLFACAAVCRSEEKPCLTCDDCRRILNGRHIDCKTYPKGGKVLVEDIGELIEDSAYKPVEGGCKVYLINGGETMEPHSQNKLLKTLEEPNLSTYVFISAANSENMLPTVKSRCFEIEMQPFSADEICGFLRGSDYKEEDAKAAALACGGMPGMALKMLESGGYTDFYDFAYSLLYRLKTPDDILACMETVNSFDDKNAAFDIISLYFRDCVMQKCGRGDLISDKGKKLKGTDNYSVKDILNFLSAAANAKKRLRLNCNAAPLFETLFMDIVSARQN